MKIKTNGERDDNGEPVQEAHYGPFEKFIGALQPITTAILIAAALGGVTMYAKLERIDERTLLGAQQRIEIQATQDLIDAKVDNLGESVKDIDKRVRDHDDWSRRRSVALDAVQKQVDEMEDKLRKQRKGEQ